MTISPIKSAVLWPLTIMLVVLIGGGVFIFWWQHVTHDAEHGRDLAANIQNTFDLIRQHDTAMMAATVRAIKQIDDVKAAYLARDRAALLGRVGEIATDLRDHHHITHFYFHLPDGISFLRAYHPDDYGDQIDRYTLNQARQTGQDVSGMEIGKRGTFTLRYVSPWYDGDRLIGFIELGEEINHITEALEQLFEVSSYLFLSKSYLSQQAFQSSPAMQHSLTRWDEFPDRLLLHASSLLPPFLRAHQHQFALDQVMLLHGVVVEEDYFNVMQLPVNNAAGQIVAAMVTVQDVSVQAHRSQQVITLVVVAGVLIGGGVLLLFWLLLDRLEDRLRRTEEHERRMAGELNQAYANMHDQQRNIQIMVDSALDAIVTIDATGRIESANPAAEVMFGYPCTTLIGQDVAEYIIPAEFRSLHRQALQRRMEATGPYEPLKRLVELQGLRADGRLIDVEVGLISLILDGSEHYTAFIHDITERKQLLRSLKETLDVAESANRAKSEFLANMSHEIRTPMNAIIGMTDLLLHRAMPPPEQQRNLEIILQSAQSLLEIINGILDLSKIDAGMMTLEQIPFDFCGQIGNACDTVAIRAHQKGLELYYQIDPDLPETLIGDPLRLKQVLINLINNAIKFTSQGEIILHVKRAPVTGADEEVWLHFTVADTGVGIAPDKLELVFERFTQADGSTTRKYGGTGLGLTISQHLVTMMGGQIWLESQVDRGTQFHFTARFGVGQRRNRGHDGQTEADERRNTDISRSLAGVRVLLAHQHATGRVILPAMLATLSADVTVAANGAALLTNLEQAREQGQPFDLLLLDDTLLQGQSPLVHKLVSDHADYQGKTILMLASNRGADGLVSGWWQQLPSVRKPVRRFQLLKVIKALRQPELSDEPRPLLESESVLQGRELPPLKILLVEDIVNNQILATTILQRAGHSVTLANNGCEAVSLYQQHSFDLILMDLQMPEMDGFEATRQIRQLESARTQPVAVPILAVTAKAMNQEQQRCLDAGMNGYLMKPYRPQQLLDQVATMVTPSTPPKAAPPKAVPQVLKAVTADAAVVAAKSEALINLSEQHFDQLTQAIEGRHEPMAMQSTNWFNDTAHDVGAWKVSIQAMRLRGMIEQHNWSEAQQALSKLQSHCQEAIAALRKRRLL
ncbi:MAG: response regulator [Magnetococcales bacterium]|nr:response regulator [Magnetococcales bacterium]